MSEVNNKIIVNLDTNSSNQIKSGTRKIIENTNYINNMPNKVDEIEIENVSTFLDDFYDVIGSNKLSKETGLDCFEAMDFDFVQKSDIKSVERKGPNGENILVTLDNDNKYLFINENGQMILNSITDSDGQQIIFADGFKAFIKMVRPSNRAGDPVKIDKIIATAGTLTVEIQGVRYHFDMNSGQLNLIYNLNTGKAIDRNMIDDKMKEFTEKLSKYLNNGTTANDIMNKYNLTADNLSYINMDYNGQLSLNFSGTSIKVNDSDYGTTFMISPYSEIEEVSVPTGETVII